MSRPAGRSSGASQATLELHSGLDLLGLKAEGVGDNVDRTRFGVPRDDGGWYPSSRDHGSAEGDRGVQHNQTLTTPRPPPPRMLRARVELDLLKRLFEDWSGDDLERLAAAGDLQQIRPQLILPQGHEDAAFVREDSLVGE